MIKANHLSDEKLIDKFFKGASEGSLLDYAILGSTGKTPYDYQIFHFDNGKYRDKLHVSKNGGNVQPFFLSVMNYASAYDKLLTNV